MSMMMSTVVLLTSSMATVSENVDERWNLLVDVPFGGSCEFASLRSLLGEGPLTINMCPRKPYTVCTTVSSRDRLRQWHSEYIEEILW